MSYLKEPLFHALGNFKKMHAMLAAGSEMPLGEMHMLKKIASLEAGKNKAEDVYVSDLHDKTQMSLPAVSQILTILENKQMIERCVSQKDRRKVTVSITDSGRQAVFCFKKKTDELLNDAINQFGAEKTEKFIQLLEEFFEVIEGIATKNTNRKDEQI